MKENEDENIDESGPELGLEESLCLRCDHCIYRSIVLFDTEGWDLPEEMSEGDPIEHLMCTKINMELDHIVTSCNKYIPTKNAISFIKNIELL